MSVSLQVALAEVSDPRHLEASVEEVFSMMLGARCSRRLSLEIVEPDSVTAVVGFGGRLSGACVLRTGARAAMDIATRMIGTPFAEVDDTVKDAIGEICNMLAGSWKARVPELSAKCGLSVPAVITGRDYTLHVQAPKFQLQHTYQFDGLCFAVTIMCDGLH